MSDQLKKIMIGCCAGFVILFIILAILVGCQNSSKSYDDIAANMLKIGKRYFEKNEDELPTDDKDTNEYTLKQMISNGDMDEISEQMKDESVKCDGGVTVTNNNGYYLYTVSLDCGEAYSTKTLADQIIDDNLVEEGHGLYEGTNEYYFRGSVINNWAEFNDEKWRIIGINKEGNIQMVQTTTKNISAYDNHYNTTESMNGLNIYYQTDGRSSTIKENIDEYYAGEDFSDEAKAYMATQTLCYGKRSTEDTSRAGESECVEGQTLAGQPLGLLAGYEVIRASIDTECSTILNKACGNYNWAYQLQKTTWLLTASTTKTSKGYKLSSTGINETTVNGTTSFLVTVTIDGKVNYTEGKGTEEEPYKIKIEK